MDGPAVRLQVPVGIAPAAFAEAAEKLAARRGHHAGITETFITMFARAAEYAAGETTSWVEGIVEEDDEEIEVRIRAGDVALEEPAQLVAAARSMPADCSVSIDRGVLIIRIVKGS